MLTTQALQPRANVNSSIHFFWVVILSWHIKGMGTTTRIHEIRDDVEDTNDEYHGAESMKWPLSSVGFEPRQLRTPVVPNSMSI